MLVSRNDSAESRIQNKLFICKINQEYALKLIGIISDSHGRHQSIIEAAEVLENLHCDHIVHLGDICDTLYPETCDLCVEAMQVYDIQAVKGNNDHMLQLNQTGNQESLISAKSMAYLDDLAPVIEMEQAVFAHSLPFYEDMGIACITRNLGKAEITRFFSMPGRKILFRGHGHSPELIWEKDGLFYREDFSTTRKIDLNPHLPCIVTCGALTRGLCMTWEIEKQELTCISLNQKPIDEETISKSDS